MCRRSTPATARPPRAHPPRVPTSEMAMDIRERGAYSPNLRRCVALREGGSIGEQGAHPFEMRALFAVLRRNWLRATYHHQEMEHGGSSRRASHSAAGMSMCGWTTSPVRSIGSVLIRLYRRASIQRVPWVHMSEYSRL